MNEIHIVKNCQNNEKSRLTVNIIVTTLPKRKWNPDIVIVLREQNKLTSKSEDYG